MPVPYKPYDMKKIVERTRKARDDFDEAAFEQRLADGQRKYDELYLAWLAQFDDAGHLKPGVMGTAGYILPMDPDFALLDIDGQAAFILDERRRLGVS